MFLIFLELGYASAMNSHLLGPVTNISCAHPSPPKWPNDSASSSSLFSDLLPQSLRILQTPLPDIEVEVLLEAAFGEGRIRCGSCGRTLKRDEAGQNPEVFDYDSFV